MALLSDWLKSNFQNPLHQHENNARRHGIHEHWHRPNFLLNLSHNESNRFVDHQANDETANHNADQADDWSSNQKQEFEGFCCEIEDEMRVARDQEK